MTFRADFMRIRKTPLQRLHYPAIPSDQVIDDIRQLVLTDRALHESVCRAPFLRGDDVLIQGETIQAVKAFVSNVRFYSKHEASYIFRVADLDLPTMAKSMGIIRLPKMPELKRSDVPDGGWLDNSIDVRR